MNARMLTANKTVTRVMATLGLTAVLAGAVLQASPANAQNWHDRRDRAAVRYDAGAIRRDQAHLSDLQHRRSMMAAHHDWAGVKSMDAAIANTRWRISNKRFDASHDFDRYYADKDRNWFYHH